VEVPGTRLCKHYHSDHWLIAGHFDVNIKFALQYKLTVNFIIFSVI